VPGAVSQARPAPQRQPFLLRGASLHRSSDLTSPSLTSLVQPSHVMGQQAVGHLLGRLGTGAMPRQVILPHQIRPGESAAKPSPRLADVIPLRPTAPEGDFS